MADVVTFDPDNLRIIEISAGGDNELSVVEIYSEWKDWLLADPARLAYPQAMRYVGGDAISPTQDLGSTFFLLNGWRIRPAELTHKLTLVGNLFTDPAGESVFVPTLAAFNVNTETRVSNLVDAVLVNSAEIQFASFENTVAVDVTSVFSGASYPNGTRRQPVNNMTDALAIAQARGIGSFLILSSMTLTGVDVSEMVLDGLNHGVTLTVDASADVQNCGFNNLTLQGTFDGATHVRDCFVMDVDIIHGHLTRCSLMGAIALSGTGDLLIDNCIDGMPGLGVPSVDCGGAGSSLNIRGYHGGIALTNKTGAEDFSIDLVGRVLLDATITGGSIIIRGIGHIELNSATATIIDSDLVNPALVAAETDTVLTTAHGTGSWQSGAGGLTVQDIVDGVLDEPTASHLAAGSVGENVNRLDAAVTSRSSHTANNVRDSILSDSTPFQGARIDAAVSSRAAPGAEMALTSTAVAGAVLAIWARVISGTTTVEQAIDELHKLRGLDPDNPLLVDKTNQRMRVPYDGSIIDIQGTPDGDDETFQRLT
jgi:hypothetical protein